VWASFIRTFNNFLFFCASWSYVITQECHFWKELGCCVGWESWVSIVSHTGLYSPGIESDGGKSFHTCPYCPGAYPAFYSMGTRSFLGAKWSGHGDDRPTPSSAEVKERVVLYLYSSSGPSWPVVGWIVLGLGQGTQNFTPAEHMFSGTISDGLIRDSVE
jgi:hypothetical protein